MPPLWGALPGMRKFHFGLGAAGGKHHQQEFCNNRAAWDGELEAVVIGDLWQKK